MPVDAPALPEAPLIAASAAKEKTPGLSFRKTKILIDRLAGLFGEFEANGRTRFLLADGGAFHGIAMRRDILDFETPTSQPRSLLSMARLNNARSCTLYCICNLVRIAQMWAGVEVWGQRAFPCFNVYGRQAPHSCFEWCPLSISVYFGGDSRVIETSEPQLAERMKRGRGRYEKA